MIKKYTLKYKWLGKTPSFYWECTMLCERQCWEKEKTHSATDWEKIFATDIPDKGLLFKIYKEHLKLSSKETSNPIKKWVRGPGKYLTKKDKQVTNKHQKWCAISCHQRHI